MARQPTFEIKFAPEVLGHLGVIERKYHSLIERTLDEQLSHTPERATRNRKQLDLPAPFGATWELRFGPRNRFRALYEVDLDAQVVWVLAIGVKKGNLLWVGAEEIEL